MWSSVVQNGGNNTDQMSQSINFSANCKKENDKSIGQPKEGVSVDGCSVQSGHAFRNEEGDIDVVKCTVEKKESDQNSETKTQFSEPTCNITRPKNGDVQPTVAPQTCNKELTQFKTDTELRREKIGTTFRHSYTCNTANIGCPPTKTTKNSPTVSRPSSV